MIHNIVKSQPQQGVNFCTKNVPFCLGQALCLFQQSNGCSPCSICSIGIQHKECICQCGIGHFRSQTIGFNIGLNFVAQMYQKLTFSRICFSFVVVFMNHSFAHLFFYNDFGTGSSFCCKSSRYHTDHQREYTQVCNQ